MAWALWLAVPVVLTLLAALVTWLRARPPREPKGISETVRAHQEFLEALGQAPRRADAGSNPDDPN